ncbi:MAG: SpoIIE family protein phosphatase, partial [Leptospiraceae bacterium]|nr:SpoIIE family protein phosphatase [Leptospiraceae bacterium]
DLRNVKYIILHHQDPDLCAAVPTIERLIQRDDLLIVTHSRMSVLIKHYGIKAKYYNVDHNDFILKTKGRTLHFYTTPYCHSPGAFVTYDEKTKVLFSSDIFGGLEESWSFYADDNYYSHIEGFHMAYMPSRDILNYALRKIEELDLELIAPQHGSIIKKEQIKPLIEQMKLMNCGLYIDKKYTVDLQRTIEKLNNLQVEFSLSLNEIKQLKRQQDADYFLTSLLMQPLLMNRNHSEKVITSSVIIQKKAFYVKNSYHQLGGDVCLTGNLNFNGENWLFFFNGDAMGKSVQGAGGAIVMGTVLNSILARGTGTIRKEPKAWLSQIFEEIQTIFLSFNGAMTISGILGLLNENTGELLSINAEHPFMVLYRDGKASFLETEIDQNKFGVEPKLEFKIKTFYLKENDVIIMGSDGKDDILLHGKEEDLNYDSELFLKIVEKTKCNLKKIVKTIFDIGDVIDDLSLLKIHFLKEPNPNVMRETLAKDEIFFMKVHSFIRNKKYDKALEILEGDSEKQSPEVLFTRGYCLIKQRRYLKSLKYLTKAIKREPNHFYALKYAGLSHLKLKNYEKCLSYWTEAKKLKPNDKLINSFYPKIVERMSKRKVLLGKKQLN